MLNRGYIIIALTFLVALILMVLPLPEWARWLRPLWVPLVLIYWVMALPNRVGVLTAWIIGLLQDVLNGTLFGEHAFALIIVAYITIKLYRQLRVFPRPQQACYVVFVLLLYQGILFLIQGISGQMIETNMFWAAAIISGFFWPWIFLLLRGCRRHFKVH
ncbi:rod shape-determining protein MreD [soil metagenome]